MFKINQAANVLNAYSYVHSGIFDAMVDLPIKQTNLSCSSITYFLSVFCCCLSSAHRRQFRDSGVDQIQASCPSESGKHSNQGATTGE